MHRQITHWFSRVAIRSFFLVNRDRLLDHFRTCESIPSTRQDSMLGHFLKKEKDVLDILNRLCPYHEVLPDLGKLVAAFESIRASPGTSTTQTPGTGPGPYAWAICYEFHKFFVSSLITYGNSLRILSGVHSELGALQKANITPKVQSLIDRLKEKLPNLFEQVSKCLYLVWRITNSRILRRHFKLLQTCHCLPFPSKVVAVPESTVFGRLTRELKLEAVIQLEEGNVFLSVNPESVQGDDESEDEEFMSILDIFHLDKSFMKWTQLLVAYRIGQNILTSQSAISASILQKLNISPVTVIQPSGVDREMEPWDDLLKSRHLHFPQDFDVNIVIEAIKNEVKTRLGESCHNIFQKFQLQEFPGNLHCEMILAVLVQHAQDPVTSSTLGCLAQDLDDSIISVSKPCCPVCWDTLQYLRANQEFAICRRHPFLSPVQLPYSLPFEILEKMTIRYTRLLQDEVVKMMRTKTAPADDSETFFMSSAWPSYNFPLSDPSTSK